MSKKIGKNIWVGLAFLIFIIAIALKFWPDIGEKVASMEPSATATALADDEKADVDANIPNPAHPIFKKKDAANVTTVIPDTPQANGVNGAPKTLKTDLGLEVSPLCFEQLFTADGPRTTPIDITTCESISGYKNIKTGIEDGRYRSLYEFPAEPDMPAEKGFASYELLGKTAAGTAVETYNETGGTGRFSSIILVNLNGNLLKLVDSVAGGDRCNNGVTEAKVENGKLIYSENITPGDFPTLAWGEDKGLKPYEDFEASAMSCFGIATFEDGKVARVTLNEDAVKETGDWTNQYTYQKCFNQKFKEALTAGHKTMTAAEFRQFMDGFLSSCVRK